MMAKRRFSAKQFVLVAALGASAMLAMSANRVHAAMSEGDVPETSVVPADSGSGTPGASPAAPSSPAAASMTGGTAPAPEPHASRPPRVVHRASTHGSAAPREVEVEPARARLRVIKADWVYSSPAKSSKHLEQLQVDKFINVSGSTHYFLRVNLKNGETGYIDPASVEILKPIDKIFRLSHDAAVLDKPNRWGKKLSEVHTGHDVHVVGLALSYARIRMKSGLEGFIPLTAME